MKCKRLFALLLATLLLLCAGCGEAPAPGAELPAPSGSTTNVSDVENPDANASTPSQNSGTAQSAIQPLLYKVADAKGNEAYLFGSIHVGRENFYPLPDYVTNAFHQSDKLAVEFDVLAFEKDVTAQTEALTQLMYLDGTTIKDHIPEQLYKDAVAIMTKHGEYTAVLDYYYPSIWSSFIDNYTVPEGATDLGIDVNLIQMAYDSNKPVVDVESAALQYGMMANYSEPLQEMLLESSVEGYKNDAAEAVEEMLDIWASGDADRFRQFLEAEDDSLSTPEEQALYAEYQKAMMTDRDAGMVRFVKQAVASGDTVFVCVGAAHVMGKNGMLDQLKAAGYTITQVR